MRLPNQIIFAIEHGMLITHIPDDVSQLVEELHRLSPDLDSENLISATIDLDLTDPGQVALAIFATEDNTLQNHNVVHDVSTGFALKTLLACAFVAGVRFGRSKPNVAVKLVDGN